MNAARTSLLVVPLFLLLACSGGVQKPEPEESSELSLAYSRLGAVQAGVVTTELELVDLVGLFDRHDDTAGAWLATQELCRYHMRMKAIASAGAVCREALGRAQLSGRREAIFTAAVQLYFYLGEDSYLQLAEQYADREQDRQVLALARGRYTELRLPEDESPMPAVRAYQYYWYGKQHADDKALEQAYELFSATDNPRGLADTLYVRARLAARRGEHLRAAELAGRAVQVLAALGEAEKSARVQAWIDNELAAR